MKRVFLACLLLFCGSILGARSAMQHPRLLNSPQALRADAPWYAVQVDSVIRAFSDEVLALPPAVRELKGRRLLGVSREVLKRIFWLSYTYRAYGGEPYARRAIAEMLAVSRFPDWNPRTSWMWGK